MLRHLRRLSIPFALVVGLGLAGCNSSTDAPVRPAATDSGAQPAAPPAARHEDHAPGAHAEPPAKVVDAEEKALYLTAAGKYTEDDIRANGGGVASTKFKGLKANHDAKPQSGDRVCPVSLTKANPAFTWVVGGQRYQFCCPPCVDEFVQLAKEHPEQVKPADEYRKKCPPPETVEATR